MEREERNEGGKVSEIVGEMQLCNQIHLELNSGSITY